MLYFVYFVHFLTETPCVSEISVQHQNDTAITFKWTAPAPGLGYTIHVCPEDTTRCLPQVNCTNCHLHHAIGLSPYTNYTVTVDSFSLVSTGQCISQGCTSNTATAQTGTYTFMSVHVQKGQSTVSIDFRDSANCHQWCSVHVIGTWPMILYS